MVDWPSDLPQVPPKDGYSEDPGDPVLRTETDVGPGISRRRFTASVISLKMNFVLSTAETVILDTFWRDTLSYGALTFNWTHPRTGEDGTFKFKKGGQPKPTPLGGDYWSVDIEVEMRP